MSSPGAQSTSPSSDNTKVIYVMGAGRSGSTILGVALGNCESIFDAGELEAWLRRSGIPNFGGDKRVEFWSEVRAGVEGKDLFGDRGWLCLEHSTAIFRVDRWAARRQLRSRYRQIAEELYHSVANVSKATYIVDTSHYPLRVRELQALNDIDLYLIYCVRNPQNVVSSFNRRDVNQQSKSPVATNVYLWVTHLLSVFVFLRHRSDRRLFLRYEDFVANPESVMRDILNHIGIANMVPDMTSLNTGIPFQGNRLLRSEVLSLRNDTASAPKRRRITTLVQLPWVAVHSALRPVAGSSIPNEQVRSRV
jgi:Sulfotransferase family